MIVAPEENSPDNPKLSVFDRIICRLQTIFSTIFRSTIEESRAKGLRFWEAVQYYFQIVIL